MPSQRSLVTGKFPEIKEAFNQFPTQEQTNFILLLEQTANNFLAISKLIISGLASPNTISVKMDNPNSFILASMYYGDIRKWNEVVGASDMNLAVMDGEDITVRLPRGRS